MSSTTLLQAKASRALTFSGKPELFKCLKWRLALLIKCSNDWKKSKNKLDSKFQFHFPRKAGRIFKL